MFGTWRRNNHGYTMIEVMISMAIVSIGVLGLVGMQVVAIRSNRQGGRMSQALFLAESKAEELLAYPFTDNHLADSNTGNDPAFGAPFAVPVSTVIDPTSYADTNDFDVTTIDEQGNACGGGLGTTCPNTASTFAAGTIGFQRFWQITTEDVNPNIPGPDLLRINVVVRFRDSEYAYGFRQVQVTVSKAWDL